MASRRARWSVGLTVVAVAVALAIAIGVAARSPGPPSSSSSSSSSGFAGTAAVRQDTAWDSLFQGYANLSGAWSGGDGAQSLALPGGGTMWFFADSYLGTIGPGGSRSADSTGAAHNAAVLYRDGHLGPTYAAPPGLGGYNGNEDYTWVVPPPSYPPGRYELINGDQVIDDGTVYKFYQLADRDLHPDHFAYKLVGTVIEAFSLNAAAGTITPEGGTPVGIEDTAGSDPVIWGAATLISGGYIYLYGVKPVVHGDTAPFPLYLARVPIGGLAAGDPWQYYRGQPGCAPPSSAWSADPRQATALRSGVSAGFSVTDVNGTYVLLTNDTSGVGTSGGTSGGTANNAVAYYAACPTGFSPHGQRYRVFRPALPRGYLTYEYRIVPQFSHGSDVLVSYSTNTIQPGENYDNVTIYRPRFLDVKLPGIGGPSGPVTEP